MSIDINTAASNTYLDSLRPAAAETPYETEAERSELKQEDFFSLLTQQLAYQDPFKPVENAEMVSQMTGFSTSEGISQLNDQITGMNTLMSSSQALQASTLVGQKVLVAASNGYSDGEGISGVIAAEADTKGMSITIENEVGEVVQTLALGDQSQGTVGLEWDGKDLAGNPTPAGNYTIKAVGLQNGKTTEMPVAVYAKVDSVSLNNELSQAALNLAGLGGVSLSDVLEVAEG